MKAERRKKWAQRGLAAALTLLVLAVLPALRTLALCSQEVCSLPDEALPLAAAPLARLCAASAFDAGARDVRVDW